MNSDFVELLSLLQRFRVRYLLIGGYAVMYYAEPRYTKDIDLFVDRSSDNVTEFAKCMEAFGFPLTAAQVEQFSQPNAMIAIGIPPGRIDFLNTVLGLEFKECWPRAQEADFHGVMVNVISREDLIRAKKAVGRPQDLIDLEKLEK